VVVNYNLDNCVITLPYIHFEIFFIHFEIFFGGSNLERKWRKNRKSTRILFNS